MLGPYSARQADGLGGPKRGLSDDGLAGRPKPAELVTSGRPASELLHAFDPLPQLLKNVRFAGGRPLEDQAVRAAIAEAEQALAGTGRLVIRPSGTEPLIRVMAEGDDPVLVTSVVDDIIGVLRREAA